MSMCGGDFADGACVGDGLSSAVGVRRVIAATGVRSELLRRHSMERVVGSTVLRGRSAEASGDDLPGFAVQAGSGQVQHDAAHRGFDPGAEFHQLFAQGADLSRSEGSSGGPQAQLLVERVGGGAQQCAQLIGEEAAATGAVDFQPMVQLFDPVLDVTSGAVDRFIQMPRRVFKVGDHEARVVFGLASGMTDNLGLDDHATALLPGAGGIAGLTVEMRGLGPPIRVPS